jgi:hypothetical protein
MWPPTLVFEEPIEFWDRVTTLNPLQYLAEPWAGYLQVSARFVFLVVHPLGDIGPAITRLMSAAVIAALAWFLLRSSAIPSRTARVLPALALPVLPIGYPGPYVGPLNSQWWIATMVLLIALAPRQRWHAPILVVAGLTGLAPCLAWPAFRDRRVFALLIPTALQAVVLVSSQRRPASLAIEPAFIVIAAPLGGAMLMARLPPRTKLGFAYLGLATLTLGSILVGGVSGSGRFLAIACIGIVLAVTSRLPGTMHTRPPEPAPA